MPRGRRTGLLVTLGLIGGAIGVTAQAPAAHADQEAAYERAFRKGTELFESGQWAEARAQFERARELDPRPVLLFNIASTYRREGDLAQARVYYKRFLIIAGKDDQLALVARQIVDELDQALAAPAPPTGDVRTPTPTAPAVPARPDPRYPLQAIDRPRTLPAGVLQSSLAMRLLPRVLMSSTTGAIRVEYEYAGQLALAYGVTSAVQLTTNALVNLSEPDRSAVAIALAVAVARGDFDAALDASLTYGFDLDQLAAWSVGLDARLRLSQRLALRSFENQLSIELDEDRDVFLRLPLGLVFQATPTVWSSFEARLIDIELREPKPALLGRDYLYLSVSGGVSVGHDLDLAVQVRLLDHSALDAYILARIRV
ncbi:MAG: hypothetical protein KA190_03690 [Kofleriaceae bacterium]|nr:hypothetical protein [Kofleriaceae bacterium]